MDGLAYVDGAVVDLAQARVPLQDRGYLLGDGVFETLRVSNGRVFRMETHMERLRRGLAVLGLDGTLADDAGQAVAGLVAAAAQPLGDDLYVRVNVTSGAMEDVAGRGGGASVTGVCRPFQPYPMQYYGRGVQVVVTEGIKVRGDPLATIKHMSFLPYVHARRAAHAVTAHDGLLCNDALRVAEASTSNMFARIDDTVLAPGPDEAALPGVTRDVVLEFIQDAGLDVETRMEVDDLVGADEAWLTNTTGGVVPVTHVGDQAIGDGVPGEWSRSLHHALEALVRGGGDA